MLFDFIYNLYHVKFSNKKLDSFYLRVITRFANLFLPAYFKLTFNLNSNFLKQNVNRTKDDKMYIVSLTTFPARIDKVWLTIESILRQKEKPDKILLWLYEGEFKGKNSLPKNLLRLEKKGLEIRFCKENLMPHKKYYYTMLEYPNANVITIDDDMFYPLNLIFKLKSYHKIYPNEILSPISRKIRFDSNTISEYKNWYYNKNNSKPSVVFLPIGVGSVLYPADSLHKEVLDIESIKKYALKADDLWLKIMSLKNKTKVVSLASEYSRFPIPVFHKNNITLMSQNIGEGKNDEIFKLLLEEYKISISSLQD